MKADRSPRNKTLTLSDADVARYEPRLLLPDGDSREPLDLSAIVNRVINADSCDLAPRLPPAFADLIIVDPPYNLDKDFGGDRFRARSPSDYEAYVESWLPSLIACAKPNATLYVCGDWKSSAALFTALDRRAIVRNRITWQREKGRGAARNWKNACEDIWFATLSNDYYFDAAAVMQRKKVLAPYRENGKPKDWAETAEGKFRLTHPANLWDDITVPYWSMRENTDHPTQKPEKLIAKLILASSPPDAIVLDPFAGSGTTAVVAKKLGRRYVCVERNRTYCLWAEKRLERAETDRSIQGYVEGAFRERNA